jgi:hypothetical protein
MLLLEWQKLQNMNNILSLVFILLIIHTSLYSQDIDNNLTRLNYPIIGTANSKLGNRSVKDDFSNYLGAVEKTISAPLIWEKDDLIKLGGFIALGAGSFLLDDEVNNLFSEDRNKTFDKLEPIGYYYGSPLTTVPATLAIYLSGVTLNNRWLRDTGLMLAETITMIAIIQVPSSFIFGRVRPHSTDNNLEFNFFNGFKQENASFISGHTAIAVGISNVLAHQINNPIATVGLYGLAAITPLARLYDNQHWFSDIFMGASIGLFISEKIISINENDGVIKKSLSFYPVMGGIGVRYNF